ncbi:MULTISPECIES: winged helix-turn-helix domain-containing protein [unclassified Streptomyces]|uniref:helix-turn-helix domain-containing protein n=1 Tax=unclassified Streptomyces TaxID=2593676 RepID=UPI002B1CD00B|nr:MULTISPECIES: winged helix-turn-helix domain-containing protein [unclassified Streptomyces]
MAARQWREGEADGVASKGSPGRPRLSGAQVARPKRELERGPLAHGWADQRWTLARVKKLIGRLFHISYAVEGTWRLLKRHSWSWQQPARRAIERDDDAVELWKKEVWPGPRRVTSLGIRHPNIRSVASRRLDEVPPDESSEPVSDDVLSVIPTDPHWQPGQAAADRAASIVEDLAPGLPDGVDVEIDVTWHDTLSVVDCGQNLQKIGCPCCGASIDTEWCADLLEAATTASPPSPWWSPAAEPQPRWTRWTMTGLVALPDSRSPSGTPSVPCSATRN